MVSSDPSSTRRWLLKQYLNHKPLRVFSQVLNDDYRVRTLTLRILRLVAVSGRALRMYLENGLDIVLVR